MCTPPPPGDSQRILKKYVTTDLPQQKLGSKDEGTEKSPKQVSQI